MGRDQTGIRVFVASDGLLGPGLAEKLSLGWVLRKNAVLPPTMGHHFQLHAPRLFFALGCVISFVLFTIFRDGLLPHPAIVFTADLLLLLLVRFVERFVEPFGLAEKLSPRVAMDRAHADQLSRPRLAEKFSLLRCHLHLRANIHSASLARRFGCCVRWLFWRRRKWRRRWNSRLRTWPAVVV